MASAATRRAKTTITKAPSESVEPDQSMHERARLLAHSYWEARGCPYGSPEEDWFRAEQEIRNQTQNAPQDIVDEASEESFPASDPPAL